ncbi:A24 family peptidase [Sphingorhabdus sp. EL138]|uniref:prepilin peptidase n=1 Tax=Sphingorhabdus sp. EL138 TaxID=2073156 RepID=UPI000D686C84|nr:A24 family peptidase [Sphingorhabdus sp. EL138]
MPDYLYPILGAVLGLIIGSFLATIVIRWPEGKSVVSGRSRCDSCDQPLRTPDLVPVLSYLARSGKCAYCGSVIKSDHPVIELGAGLVGGMAMFAAPGLAGLLGAIFGWILLTLAALDAQHHWLPDRLTLPLAATGLASAFFVPEPDIVDRLIGAFSGFFTLFLVGWSYHKLRGREGLGGGDPKLLGAIGCWLGWSALPLVILGATLAGLLAALMMRIRGDTVAADSMLPFGGFLAIAAFPLWIIQTMTGGIFL